MKEEEIDSLFEYAIKHSGEQYNGVIISSHERSTSLVLEFGFMDYDSDRCLFAADYKTRALMFNMIFKENSHENERTYSGYYYFPLAFRKGAIACQSDEFALAT